VRVGYEAVVSGAGVGTGRKLEEIRWRGVSATDGEPADPEPEPAFSRLPDWLAVASAALAGATSAAPRLTGASRHLRKPDAEQADECSGCRERQQGYDDR